MTRHLITRSWTWLNRQLDTLFHRIKPRSTAWRTTILVSLVSLFSLFMSLAFFWRTLYLPELRQHAHYLAIELELLRESEQQIEIDPFALNLHEWILQTIGVEMVRDPAHFPNPKDKVVADFFTDELRVELERELQEPVMVYFEFKPEPQLWIHYPSLGEVWVREPLVFYAEYSSELILAWLLGIPLLTSIITLILVRQLNRPLARLQHAAQAYTNHTELPILSTERGPIEIRQVNAELQRAGADDGLPFWGVPQKLLLGAAPLFCRQVSVVHHGLAFWDSLRQVQPDPMSDELVLYEAQRLRWATQQRLVFEDRLRRDFVRKRGQKQNEAQQGVLFRSLAD